MTLALLASACSGGKAAPSTTTTPPDTASPATVPTETSPATDDLPVLPDIVAPEWTPATRTEELLAKIGEGGAVNPQDAIDLFDLAYGGMPGATPTSLPPGDPPDGTFVLGLINRVRGQLAPEQLAAVDAVENPPDDGSAGVPISGASSGFRAPVVSATQTRFDDLMAKSQQDWRAYRPELPFMPLRVRLLARSIGAREMEAVPDPRRADGCLISVYPRMFKEDDAYVKAIFAHEIFHCMQFTWDQWGHQPAWLIEGSAEWAMMDLYRNNSAGTSKRTHVAWYSDTSTRLVAREYDAWPLYETLRQRGGDPYAAIKAMIASGKEDLPTLLQLGGLDGVLFRSDWSSRVLRQIQWSEKEWWLDWPTANAAAGPLRNTASFGTRGVGTYAVYGNSNYGHTQVTVTMGSKVGLVSVVPARSMMSTHARDRTVTIAAMKAKRFCFDPGGCKCPEGEDNDATQMDGRDMVFSFPADAKQPFAAVKAVEWDPKKFCKRPQPPSASHNGDPHLATFDGLPYDVMSFGEFEASRDPKGGFEVQVRQEPFGALGTGTTAVALGDGTHRVTFTASALSENASLALRVDGQTTDSASPTSPDGLRIAAKSSSEWTVTWPDNSVVDVMWHLGWFVTVQPEGLRAKRLVGLLGNADDDVRNDLRHPDGTLFDPPLEDRTRMDDFAREWLVNDRSTLFDYEPGQSPATFNDLPRPKLVPAPDDATVATCRDHLGPTALQPDVDACAYDITATGNDGFLDAYAAVVEARSSDGSGSTPNTTTPGSTPGGATSGAPSLVLSGSLAAASAASGGAVTALTGSLTLKAGAVVVARAALCPAGVTLSLLVSARTGGGTATANLCDPAGLRNYLAKDPSELVAGENYVYIGADGAYDLTVTSDATTAYATQVSIYADPTPTVVDSATALSKGWSGTLQGTGDAVVLPIATGSRSVTWNVTVDPGVCARDVNGADAPGKANPFTIDVCGHRSTISFTPTGTLAIPMVLFARSNGPVKVAFTPAG